MNFDEALNALKEAFPAQAWAYAVGYNHVQIGKWNAAKLEFKEDFEPETISELRVFTNTREIRIVRANDIFLLRDSKTLDGKKVIDEKYIMYGEQIVERVDGYSALKEIRGGNLWFPLEMKDNFKNLKLGIRNYYRYNRVPVLGIGKNYDEDWQGCGKGAFEFYDYAFTGFYYADDLEVNLS